MRRDPYHEPQQDNYEQVLHISEIALATRHLMQRYPQVIVDEEEYRAYEHGLHDP